jgi:hypothetical protein
MHATRAEMVPTISESFRWGVRYGVPSNKSSAAAMADVMMFIPSLGSETVEVARDALRYALSNE